MTKKRLTALPATPQFSNQIDEQTPAMASLKWEDLGRCYKVCIYV